MVVFLTFAGLVITLYTVYCGLGLWMAQHVNAVERGEEPMVDENGETILDQLPKSHIDMMMHYYNGMPGVLWRVAFLCLIGALGGLLTDFPYTVHLFGLALGLDCLLFITYEKRNQFLDQTSMAERIFDGTQYIALLAAFLILAWERLRPL